MATQDHTASAAEILEPSPMAQMRRRVFGHYGIIIGGAVLAIIFAIAIFAPLLTPFDPILDQDLAQKLKPPFWHDSPKYDPAHPLGTDLQGTYMMLFVFSTSWRAYLLWIIFSLYEKINNKDFTGIMVSGESQRTGRVLKKAHD